MAASREIREGDWTCPGCNNHNFASRHVCNRCRGARPAAGEDAKPGDWMCPGCSNHNFARRTTCNKCSAPKPGVGFPALPSALPPGLEAAYGQFMMNPMLAFGAMMAMAQAAGAAGAPLHIASPRAAAPAPAAPVEIPKNFKNGDWMCQGCGNHNFASRDSCNKCHARKARPVPTSSYGAASYGAAPVENFAGKRYNPYGPGVQAVNMKDGDWMCPNCNNHNFASRTACNKCRRPKS